MRFVYSLIRFVPDPARGEFVNVGAIVGSEDSSEWQVRQIENPTRARRLDDRSLLDGVWSFIDRVGTQIDQFESETESLFGSGHELSEGWLEDLYEKHRNIVQLSAPTPVVAENADEAMDRVFEHLILDPAARRYRFQKKNTALAAVRQAYSQRSLRKGIDIRERVMLRTKHHDGRFDFAVTNGKVLQLTQTFSFQVPEQERLTEQIRAWGWTIRDARSDGGEIEAPDGQRFGVDNDVDIEVVYVPPVADDQSPALDDARSVFEALGVKAYPFTQAPQVATRANDLLVAARGGRLALN